MAVSYRYHAYSPQKATEGRRLKRRAKQKLTESELASHHTTDEETLHYGHRFAQTEERAHERQGQHQGKGRTVAGAKMSRPQQQGVASRGVPIGALPPTDEPIAEPDLLLEPTEPLEMEALVGDVRHQLEVLTGAIRDLGASSWRLARFPLDAAKVLRGRKRH